MNPATAPELQSAEKPMTDSGVSAKPSEESVAASASDGATSQPAAEPSLLALCEEGCKKTKARCTETAYESCRMNCSQYEHPPAGCETEAREALECARDAEDAPCVNIAPEICSNKFRRAVGCFSGKPFETKDEAPKVPEAWARFEAKTAGFATMAPRGMSESGDGFGVQQPDAEYLVRVLPAPQPRPTQKGMVHVALGALGKCTKHLKLYGMVDRPDRIFIRFDSACPDGVSWRGAFVIAGAKMFMPYVSIAAGVKSKPEVDAFLYGFEVTNK